jgi:uncharacterized protein (TIGR02996 family)
MSSHPTADAFMRSYLRTPTDATARLVFADWLEETGTESNVAWAYYIRAKIEADRHDRGTPARKAFEDQAATSAPQVRANLTIPAKLFVDFPKSLLQLLPAPHIQVCLAGFEFMRAILELVPNSVACTNLMIPIHCLDRNLFIAIADPRDADTVQGIEFITNRDVIAVGADKTEIQDAINTAYGETVTENLDAERIESLECVAIWDGTPEHRELLRTSGDPLGLHLEWLRTSGYRGSVILVNLILREARRREADRILISSLDGLGYRFRVEGKWSPKVDIPPGLLEPIFARLALLAEVEFDLGRSTRAEGEICMQFTLCNSPYPGSRDRFTVRATFDWLDEGLEIQLDLTTEPAHPLTSPIGLS